MVFLNTLIPTRMASIESKLVVLYFSALLGASASEIEVCRVGLWGCDPLRGAWAVHTGATPMLVILIFTPMSKRLLAIVGVTVGTSLLLFGIRSAHSEGSLTWPTHLFMLWCIGILGAVTLLGFLTTRSDRVIVSPPPPPPSFAFASPIVESTSTLRPMSTSGRLTYFCTGAILGGLLGQIELHRTETESLPFVIVPIWLVLIVGSTVAPIIIVLLQTNMEQKWTSICSSILGILVLGCSILYAHTESLLGYMCLWCAGIVAALAALTLQRRVPRVAG